jgi:hypothetical protein
VEESCSLSSEHEKKDTCDSFDEVDGDIAKLQTERKFHLPLIKDIEQYNYKKVNIKGIHRSENVTLPSKRVSRTIDFNVVTTSSKEADTRSAPLSSLFYAPSVPLSLSPIASFPFRQNELASPDSPLSSGVVTQSASVPNTRQIVHSPYANKTISDLKGNAFICNKHSECKIQSETIHCSDTSTVVKTSENVISKNTLPNTYLTENCKSNFEQSQSKAQDILHQRSTMFPHIWRPIPQMASPSQQIVSSTFGLKSADNQPRLAELKQRNCVYTLPVIQTDKSASMFQVYIIYLLSCIFYVNL